MRIIAGKQTEWNRWIEVFWMQKLRNRTAADEKIVLNHGISVAHENSHLPMNGPFKIEEENQRLTRMLMGETGEKSHRHGSSLTKE